MKNPNSFLEVCLTQSTLIWTPPPAWRMKMKKADIAYWAGILTRSIKNKCKHDKEVSMSFDPAIMIMLLTDYLWNVEANPESDRLDRSAIIWVRHAVDCIRLKCFRPDTLEPTLQSIVKDFLEGHSDFTCTHLPGSSEEDDRQHVFMLFSYSYLSITPPSLMALFQSFRVAFPARCTNCLGLMSWSLNCKRRIVCLYEG